MPELVDVEVNMRTEGSTAATTACRSGMSVAGSHLTGITREAPVERRSGDVLVCRDAHIVERLGSAPGKPAGQAKPMQDRT